MKIRALLMLAPALLTSSLELAAPAAAGQSLPAPTEEWESATLLEVGTGKVLGHWVPAQSEMVIEMEVKTGRVLQRIACDEWQDANAPQGCDGQEVGMAPYRPGQLAGLLGLVKGVASA
ncbi:hypothetical protein ABNP34_04990 [Glutamicibacter mishrai]|uniref:hypothetical protein n=1 Tax=Glutamicibacter mishrai TaxID=1775880 RepID=UPI0032EC2E47